MNLQELDKDTFDNTANDANMWLLHANDTHVASQVLREKAVGTVKVDMQDVAGSLASLQYAGLIPVGGMLQGFSIEAYLKAFWLLKGNKLAKDGVYKLDTLKKDNHDLSAIADAVGFRLSADERHVLSRLSHFVTSYGRYPVTKKWSTNPMKKDAGGVLHRLSWNQDDFQLVETVLARVKAECEGLKSMVNGAP